jgi:hypothetical protein
MTATNINKLTALQVKKASKTGRYSDGNCLYLYVDDSGMMVLPASLPII